MGPSVTDLHPLPVPPDKPFAAKPDAVVILAHELSAAHSHTDTPEPVRRRRPLPPQSAICRVPRRLAGSKAVRSGALHDHLMSLFRTAGSGHESTVAGRSRCTIMPMCESSTLSIVRQPTPQA